MGEDEMSARTGLVSSGCWFNEMNGFNLAVVRDLGDIKLRIKITVKTEK